MEIQVTEMCKMTFSIDKSYQCEVLYDIIDMDVCHLILGRPWQFNEGIWYDGRANAYVVEWKGEKLWLLSYDTNSTILKQDKVAFLAITRAEILKEIKEDNWLLVVQVIEPIGESTPALEVVQKLLNQF